MVPQVLPAPEVLQSADPWFSKTLSGRLFRAVIEMNKSSCSSQSCSVFMLLAYPLEQFTFNNGKTQSQLTHTNETNVSSLHAYMRNLEGHVFICAYLHANLCMFCVSFMVNVHLSSTLHAQCNMQIKHQLLMLELFPIFLRHTTCTGS